MLLGKIRLNKLRQGKKVLRNNPSGKIVNPLAGTNQKYWHIFVLIFTIDLTLANSTTRLKERDF